MQRGAPVVATAALAVLFGLACAPANPAVADRAEQGAPAPGAGRTLVMISGGEPQSFAAKPLQEGAADTRSTHAKPVFNAALVYFDQQGLPQPFLAAALPDLSTDTWTLLPDGRMETIYRLKPNLAWHDGQPLAA